LPIRARQALAENPARAQDRDVLQFFPPDQAVVKMANVNPERKVVILAGTNTYGCQAAAEFVTNENLLRDLYTRLGVRTGNTLPDFEALLKVVTS
jgi:hypothetical protein